MLGIGLATLLGMGAVSMAMADDAARADDLASPEERRAAEPRLPDPGARDAQLLPPDAMVGAVIGIDRDHGVAVVATPRGLIALRGSPQQLSELNVGDRIQLRPRKGTGEMPRPDLPRPGVSWL
jgi:hypothetical protein